jgi:hypothetical protein
LKEFGTNSIEFVACTVVLCVAFFDGLKGLVALFSVTLVVLLLEYTSGVLLVVDTAECGMLQRSMQVMHVVAECATGVAMAVGMRYPAMAGQDQMLVQVLH